MTKSIVVLRAAVALSLWIALCPQLASAGGTTETWVRIVGPHPSARTNMPMAYDPVARNIVLFGGYDGTSYLNDTWIFNGSSWVQLNPPVSPPARTASAMAFDQKLGKMMMFGGYNGTNYLGDTWIWDGGSQTWTQANPTHLPTPVTLPMMFTDPLNGHASMVGGYDGFLYQNITWQWTGTDWKRRNPPTWITARGAALVANDYGHAKVVIYGGLADLNPLNTWTWDGLNWTEESTTTKPGAAFYTSAAYDPALGEVVAFGGGTPGALTWAWTGSEWIELTTLHSPTPRDSQAMAYDPESRQLIMFGGETSQSLLDGTYRLLVQ